MRADETRQPRPGQPRWQGCHRAAAAEPRPPRRDRETLRRRARPRRRARQRRSRAREEAGRCRRQNREAGRRWGPSRTAAGESPRRRFPVRPFHDDAGIIVPSSCNYSRGSLQLATPCTPRTRAHCLHADTRTATTCVASKVQRTHEQFPRDCLKLRHRSLKFSLRRLESGLRPKLACAATPTLDFRALARLPHSQTWSPTMFALVPLVPGNGVNPRAWQYEPHKGGQANDERYSSYVIAASTDLTVLLKTIAP